MRRIVLSEPYSIQVVDAPSPEPGVEEALVEMTSLGLCSSDVAAFQGSNLALKYPVTLGHEGVGVVRATGGASTLAVGQYVVVFPSVTCGRCAACLQGRDNHCGELKVMGVGYPNGVFASRVAVRTVQLIPINQMLAESYGALIEPVGLAVHVSRRAPYLDASVLVIGSGVIGLLTAQVVAAGGAQHITMVDRHAQRRDAALAQGEDDFVLYGGEDLTAELGKRSGSSYDVVFDTVGTIETYRAGTSLLRPGGCLVAIASPTAERTTVLDYGSMYRKELSFVLSRNYIRSDFREAIELLTDGRLDPRTLVTGTFPMDRVAEALWELVNHPERHLKIMIDPVG